MRNYISKIHSRHGRAIGLATLIPCVLLVFILVLPSTFVLANAKHEHNHDGEDGGCSTCTHVLAARKLIEHLGTALVLVAAVSVALISIAALPYFAEKYHSDSTLVGLKVRLDI